MVKEMETTLRRDGTVFLCRVPGKIVSVNSYGGNVYAIREGAPPVEIKRNGEMKEIVTLSPEERKTIEEARCLEEF